MKIKGFMTNLGKYVEGELVGEWVTFPIDEDDLQEVYKRIGIDFERYEEVFFTEWEYYDLGEYISIREVNELAERLEDIRDDDFDELLETEYDNFETMLDICERGDYIIYWGKDMEGLADERLQEVILPSIEQEWLREIVESNFDLSNYADELESQGQFYETTNGVVEIL